MPLFKLAAEQWLESKKPSLSPQSVEAYEQFVSKFTGQFGNRLICDIHRDDIAALQNKRLREGLAGRTVNYEVHTLRMILKHYNLWWQMADTIKMVRERQDIGKALSRDEETRLIGAAAVSEAAESSGPFSNSCETVREFPRRSPYPPASGDRAYARA